MSDDSLQRKICSVVMHPITLIKGTVAGRHVHAVCKSEASEDLWLCNVFTVKIFSVALTVCVR